MRISVPLLFTCCITESIFFVEVAHELIAEQGWDKATSKIQKVKFPPPFFNSRICPGLSEAHIMEVCKKVVSRSQMSKETLYKKGETYATQTELYPRKIRGIQTKVRVLMNFISINVYRDHIIARAKSEKAPRKGKNLELITKLKFHAVVFREM